jgi:hypothetical protein
MAVPYEPWYELVSDSTGRLPVVTRAIMRPSSTASVPVTANSTCHFSPSERFGNVPVSFSASSEAASE